MPEADTGVIDRGSAQSGDPSERAATGSAGWSFGAVLAVIAILAFVARVAYVLIMRDQAIFVDALGYHFRGQLFADGHGIVLPAQQILGRGGNPPDAQNPPMWSLVLGVFAKVGLRSILWQQLLSCVIGTATVVMTGLAGRAAFGRRVGLIAAALVAVYPNVWIYERELMSEPLAMLGVATVIWLAYRYRAEPSVWRVLLLGVVIGLLALTRSEQILILALVVLPLVLLTPGLTWLRRIAWLAVAGVACGLVISPWTIYNLSRFERPVLLSNGAGQAMRAGNCDPTYSGKDFGSFSTIGQPGDPHGCSILTKHFSTDQTVADSQLRSAAFDYIGKHKSRVPVVVAARIGRTFNFFRPFQQVHIEAERRSSLWIVWLAMFSYWFLLPFAIYGAVIARRRKIPIYPLVAFIITVVISVSLTIGNVRYRRARRDPARAARRGRVRSAPRALAAQDEAGARPDDRAREPRRGQPMTSMPTCLVLGGGPGTRMLPATTTLPKPLLPVAGEPFAVHQLRWLASEGVTDVVYSIGYLGDMVRAALSGRSDLGCSVAFVDEGDRRLGTGGAVRFAMDEGALGERFFVLYGDSYLRIDLASVVEAFERSDADSDALMTVYRNDGAWDTSNVVFDGRRVVRYDKSEPDPAGAGMRYIDYGLSIVRAETVRSRLPADGPSDLAALFQPLSADGRLAGYEATHRFFEIGSPEGLAELQRHLASITS